MSNLQAPGKAFGLTRLTLGRSFDRKMGKSQIILGSMWVLTMTSALSSRNTQMSDGLMNQFVNGPHDNDIFM